MPIVGAHQGCSASEPLLDAVNRVRPQIDQAQRQTPDSGTALRRLTEQRSSTTPQEQPAEKGGGKVAVSQRTRSGERRENHGLVIVGIGASAGGLEAVTELLEHLPESTGMAFVVVQHLDPHHQSLLSELLGRRDD